MDEIDLKELIRYFVKKIPLIMLIAIVVISLGETYSFYIKKPLYKGDTTLILVNNSTQNTTITQNDISINQKLVSTYSKLVKSRRVLTQVIDQLNLKYTIDELSSMITVTSLDNTEIIKISVSNENSKRAVKIADTLATVFEKEVKTIYNMENVAIIDAASENKDPYNKNIVKESVIYVGAGFALAFAVVFVVFYFDTTIKSSEELERKLNVPVLGTIPKYNLKSSKKKKEKKRKGDKDGER